MITCRVVAFGLVALLPAAFASAAELRSSAVRYDGGEAIYQVAESQHVICDDCPSRRNLVSAPLRPTQPTQPPAPERLYVDGIIPSPHTIAAIIAEPSVLHPAPHPLATIYFNLNSIRLGPAEKRRLRVAVASGIDAEVTVKVEGHTCRIGTAAYNRKLSTRRAKAVSQYLRSLGVPIREVVGLGNTHPLGGKLSKDRRAEIIIRERNYIP